MADHAAETSSLRPQKKWAPASGILAAVTAIEGPRALGKEEWEELRRAANTAFRPGGGDLLAESPVLFAPENRDNLRVLVDGGRILAHAGFVRREASVLGRTISVACLGGVFTDPARRGQGLATRVIEDALRRAREGADLVLVSGDGPLYRRARLDPVPPLTLFRLAGGPGPGADLDVRPAAQKDTELLRALHDREPVRFLRDARTWDLLLGAGRLVDAPALVSILRRGGEPVAYVATQQAGNRPDGSPRPRRILEFAGDRSAILAAAASLADELLVPSYDQATRTLAERHGLVPAVRQFLLTADVLTADVRAIPWYGFDYV